MLRVFFFQTLKHEVNRVLEVLVVLAGFRRIYHFKHRCTDAAIAKWDDRLLTPLVVSFRDGKFNVVDASLCSTVLENF